MNKPIILTMALTLCVVLAMWSQAQDEDDLDGEEEDAVTVMLTKLDVNDTTLELHYKIKNSSDHNVWVCDSVDVHYGLDFEVYLAEDGHTLVIRKRLDVPASVVWDEHPDGRYVRLRPGEDRAESVSLSVPVRQSTVYVGHRVTGEQASRLVVEIGFYNEDLPAMIRGILEVAERLGCASPQVEDYDSDTVLRFFRGFLIADTFGGLSGFEKYTYKEESEQIVIPYNYQVLTDEQVLRIVIEHVSVPYAG